MIATVSIEFVGDTEQHLKVLEHQLKHIHDVDVDLVEPKDLSAPALIAIGISKGGERAMVAAQNIAQTLYDFLHVETIEPDGKKLYLVTAEGERIDIEPLAVSDLNNIIGAAYEGESM